jgi:hypothetical protein
MTINVTSASNLGKLWLIENAILKAITGKRLRTLTYEDLAMQTGHSYRGPWKPWLDHIARKYTSQGLPDITFAVRAAGPDNYPRQIDYIIRSGRKPTRTERRKARQEMQQVIDHYNPGSPNPY